MRRYLAAFGPASVKDFQIWSGLRRVDAAFEQLRADLELDRDESGAELFERGFAHPPHAAGGRPGPRRLEAPARPEGGARRAERRSARSAAGRRARRGGGPSPAVVRGAGGRPRVP
ncbi:crosslink repair DNA glycosylase YcaQ family protein [Actinomadura sp. OS1-43]|nr:crosslink repair DNA glycosylase YcaQ family protein [Actinomadura sp. OS1-43]MDL4814528.1 crosslink repair DNA glycosylase YcaQ family protein [Actinomadura sp. OS1-43]